jgi:PKHD-type hydroxylase
MSLCIPLPPTDTYNKSTHAFWENFLADEEIDKILAHSSWFENEPSKVTLDTSQETSNYDKTVRSSTNAWLPYDSSTKFFYDKLTEVVNKVNKTYFQFDLTGFYEPGQLTIYKGADEDHYSCHCDNFFGCDVVPRKLSMSLLLSHPNEFVGGDLEIFPQSLEPVKLEQKRGRAWFFPSYMLHRVNKVTAGTRRSLVLWIGGPSFK